ncbi:hypothetical protein OAN60_08520, partial [Flavobacteriaceae bacterium]|nr:hypothetical protein [Flavobacteriaceae bacterium]
MRNKIATKTSVLFLPNTSEGKPPRRATTSVLSPAGYEYPYNAYTVDFYDNISDVFSPFNSDDITWPKEMASLGELKTAGFWKRVIWQRV